MASDYAQYNRALREWDSLHEQGKFSVPIDQGAVAILWSDFTIGDSTSRRLQKAVFSEEAYDISRELNMLGIDCQVYGSFTLNNAREVLADPDFTSVVTIGHGNLSETYSHQGESFDWRFVAKYAKHLKTGRFTQRHCGQAIRDLSVPLGTFAMEKHSKVYAAFDTYLPTEMKDEYEDKIEQLHPYSRLTYRALKSLFPRLSSQEEVVLDDEDKPDTEILTEEA